MPTVFVHPEQAELDVPSKWPRYNVSEQSSLYSFNSDNCGHIFFDGTASNDVSVCCSNSISRPNCGNSHSTSNWAVDFVPDDNSSSKSDANCCSAMPASDSKSDSTSDGNNCDFETINPGIHHADKTYDCDCKL